jgi:phage-related protein
LKLPNTDFEIAFQFKTSSVYTSLFSIDSTAGGHDRHLFLENGKLYARVWPGAKYQVWSNSLADD